MKLSNQRDRRIIQEFKKFLIEERLLISYKANIREASRLWTAYKCEPYNLVHAFSWNYCKRGSFKLWNTIDVKWLGRLRALNL